MKFIHVFKLARKYPDLTLMNTCMEVASDSNRSDLYWFFNACYWAVQITGYSMNYLFAWKQIIFCYRLAHTLSKSLQNNGSNNK